MGGIGIMNDKRKSAERADGVRRGATRAQPMPPKKERNPLKLRINWQPIRRIAYAVVAVVAVGLAVEGWKHAYPHLNQPIGRIMVKGDLTEHNQHALQQEVAPFVDTGFLSVDIDGIQHSLEQIAWVERADIRRIWPNELVIEVVPHKPVARWGETELLSVQADIFAQQGMQGFEALPFLAGPADSQDQVMQQYRLLTQALRPLGQTVERLEMRERGSWFLTTNTGLELLLGREQIMEKIRRLVTLYEKELKEQMNQIARIDLRYANGLAVTWREVAKQDAVVQ